MPGADVFQASHRRAQQHARVQLVEAEQRAKDKAQVAELKEAFRDVSLTQDNTSFWDGICIALGCKPANDNR